MISFYYIFSGNCETLRNLVFVGIFHANVEHHTTS